MGPTFQQLPEGLSYTVPQKQPRINILNQALGDYFKNQQEVQQNNVMRSQLQQIMAGQMPTVSPTPSGPLQALINPNVTMKPTPIDLAIAEAKIKSMSYPQQGIYTLDAEGKPVLNGYVERGSKITNAGGAKGFGSSIINFAEKNAPDIAEAVKRGDFSGFNNADRYTKSAVARILSSQGFNVTEEALSLKGKEKMASTGAGVQDAKVNQAIHLRALADQYYDPTTGNYNVPQAQYAELVMGLASLVANSNVATDAQRAEIRQRTAAGDINGLATYLTGSPKNANTQDVIKNLIDSIDRQGQVAEDERNKYLARGGYGSSFKSYLANSPSKAKPSNPYVARSAETVSPSTGTLRVPSYKTGERRVINGTTWYRTSTGQWVSDRTPL